MSETTPSVSVSQAFRIDVPNDRAFMVRHKDWDRIRRRLESAKGQRKEFSGAGWAFVGIFVSALFAGIAWSPTYRSLPVALRPDAAWVWPTIIILGCAALLIAGTMFWASHITKGAERVSIDEVLEDMDEIAGPPNP